MTYASDVAQAAIDDTFAEFGRSATYTPSGGPPVACTVVVDVRGDEARPDDHRPIKGGHTFELRKSEIPAPAQGALITFDGRSVTIVNRPWTDDEEGLVWKMWAV